jgi:hypothetical protein
MKVLVANGPTLDARHRHPSQIVITMWAVWWGAGNMSRAERLAGLSFVER